MSEQQDEWARHTEHLLTSHLERSGVLQPARRTWRIAHSDISGRGVVATADLEPGDVVLVDTPLVLAPRASPHSPPLCSTCHKAGVPLRACVAGCGLPLCPCCLHSPAHRPECSTLQRWRGVPVPGGGWSPRLLWTLAAVRCLRLSAHDRPLLRCLLAHAGPRHAIEVEILNKELEGGPGPSQEEQILMRLSCKVMDANAFDTPGPGEDDGDSWHLPTRERTSCLRGLYPLAAMMNHVCSPNTRRGFDAQRRMVVRAAVRVKTGEELTNSYTTLLWGTPARRRHLLATKHFLCACARCSHPQEWGAKMSALACPRAECTGSVLPSDPLQLYPTWQCDTCKSELPGKQAILVQVALGKLLVRVDTTSPRDIHEFFVSHARVVPASNQVMVQLKCDLICLYGHRKGLLYTELSDNDLQEKFYLCKEILHLLATLRTGECSMKGLISYELACTLLEMKRRLESTGGGGAGIERSKCLAMEGRAMLEQSALIFQDDVTAPADLWKLLETARGQRDVTSPLTNGS